jgi:histidinol-phosphatase (PHP family)
MLPADDHSHTEWSWDAVAGSMAGSCARAVELGLPAIAFTEHVDLTRWVVRPELHPAMRPHELAWIDPGGRFHAPELDLDGYLACVGACRERFSSLRIRAGLELEAPHWYAGALAPLTGRVERLLGGLHTVVANGEPWMVEHLILEPTVRIAGQPGDVYRAYLAELAVLAASPGPWQILSHIDYPVRVWPGPWDPHDFEPELRAVLEALAGTGRALECNTKVPLQAEVVAWWHEAGGDALSFGSDAHRPGAVAARFAAAAAMAEGNGFRPGRDPADLWRRA